jgi:hypothetical protein
LSGHVGKKGYTLVSKVMSHQIDAVDKRFHTTQRHFAAAGSKISPGMARRLSDSPTATPCLYLTM